MVTIKIQLVDGHEGHANNAATQTIPLLSISFWIQLEEWLPSQGTAATAAKLMAPQQALLCSREGQDKQ